MENKMTRVSGPAARARLEWMARLEQDVRRRMKDGRLGPLAGGRMLGSIRLMQRLEQNGRTGELQDEPRHERSQALLDSALLNIAQIRHFYPREGWENASESAEEAYVGQLSPILFGIMDNRYQMEEGDRARFGRIWPGYPIYSHRYDAGNEEADGSDFHVLNGRRTAFNAEFTRLQEEGRPAEYRFFYERGAYKLDHSEKD